MPMVVDLKYKHFNNFNKAEQDPRQNYLNTVSSK